MEPFRLRFTLTRRQRLAAEVMPWLPAAAATLGFGVGAAYLALNASPWFLWLLAGPPLAYPGLFGFAFGVARGGAPVEVLVDDTSVEVVAPGERQKRALGGIFQVFRAGNVWTVLHLDGSVLTIPADAITTEQIGFLKSFARRSHAGRA